MSDTKVVVKKNDVTCWNCFTTEDGDTLSDTEDDNYRPVTLPKVRKEHREKFKVYSFLASELSKPKAVTLKHKVSTHCSIAKKIDEKFLEQLTKDTENMNLRCGKNISDETLSTCLKQNQEDIVRITNNDTKDFDVSDIELDLQNVESTTSKDDTNDSVLENTTQYTKLTMTKNFASISDINKTIQNNFDCNNELSNSSKIAELNLTLPPTVVKTTELTMVTPPQLKEISFISPNNNSTLETHDAQTKKKGGPENDVVLKPQCSISSDVAIKSTDPTDSNYCTENINDSNVLSDVICENSKTNTITKLPITKQNVNSRYSPLYKLKRSASTDEAIDVTYKSFSETMPTVCRKTCKGMGSKEIDLKTTVSGSFSKIETKPLSMKKTDTKNLPLLPNQGRTESSSTQVSYINKDKGLYLSKTSMVTSKSLPNVTLPTFRKKVYITPSKSTTSKTPTINTTEKISILKRKSSELSIEPKHNISTDSSYCVENMENMNLSQGVHRKYSKSDIGTKIPVLKQTMNSKYSPLHKLKIANSNSKDKIVFNNYDTDVNGTLTESRKTEHGKKSEETTLEFMNLSDNNDNRSDVPLVMSTPKNIEIDNKFSDASDETNRSPICNTTSLYSLSESTFESGVHNVGECKNSFKSETEICAVVGNEKENEYNFDFPNDTKFSKRRSVSTEVLGKLLCPSIKRRSTLSMDPRSLNLADEMYISEESPGHATLPRRSNSPLPHERELDRERFPHNRSGLQTRSESMASVYSGAGEGVRGGVPVRGEVQFSLVYNYRLGALEVGVKRCRDLAPIDVKKNRSDPYVKVYLLPDKSKTGKRKTKVKKNTLNPVFEETLSFQSSLESLSTRALWLSAWHADMFGRNDFLGEVTLPLAGRVFDDPAPSWHALGERSERPEEASGSRGDLIVGLKFELEPRASTGTLHVLVKEARRLVPSRPGALADVFCKSYLLPERGRLHKQKTPVCRRTLAPSWRAGLQYTRVAPAGLAERALELTLWDRDRLASNEFLGAVRLSRGTGMYRGESVSWMDSTGKEVSLWETMLQQPNFWVEGSLPLRPHLNN